MSKPKNMTPDQEEEWRQRQRQTSAAWKARNKQRSLFLTRRWRKANRARSKENYNAWVAKNRDRKKVYNRLQRQKKMLERATLQLLAIEAEILKC